MSQHTLRVTALLAFVIAASFLTAADPPPPEVAKLLSQLKATKAATRLKAVTDLGNLKEKAIDSADVLANVAEGDPDVDVRNAARTSRAAIIVAAFTVKLKDPEDRVRLQAAKELGKLKFRGTGAVEELAKVAENDSDGDVRRAAQKAVETIKDSAEKRKVVQPFFKALQSKKPAERIEAMEQLAKLGEKAQGATFAVVLAMMDGTPAIREAAASCLEKVDPKLHKHVVTMLFDTSETKKAEAEEALGKLGERAEGAVPALKARWSQTLANAGDSSLRLPDYAALIALVSIAPDDPQVANEVLRLLASPYRGGFDGLVAENNRVFAFRLMDRIDVPAAKKVAALSAALSAATTSSLGDQKGQLTAIEQLVKHGAEAKPALPVLMKLKLSNSEEVRKAAGAAVEKISAAK
jgi:HEAT repeat protein